MIESHEFLIERGARSRERQDRTMELASLFSPREMVMDFSFANARPEKAYFFKVNQELIKALHEKEMQQLEHHIQELHYMKCPKCGHDLRHTKFGELVV